MDLEKVTEHIKYLKEQIKTIKGVKINYHEKYVSQIEAVLTRGDEGLCKYIEALYKKGCYLDAWGEYFNKDVWYETAAELGINLSELAQTQYDLEKPLRWDFIDIGVNKEWFKNEYREAFNITTDSKHIVPTCQTKCVNCGVCKNLNTHKVMDKPFTASPQAQTIVNIEKEDPKTCKNYDKPIFKYRIKLTKTDILKYFSHLDWQNTFFKAIARTDLNVVFSQGFNPTMKISMGVALPLFAESITELVDIELFDNYTAEELKLKLEKVLPPQSQILSIVKIEKSAPAIDITAQWAEYEITSSDKNLYDFDKLKYNTDRVLSSEEIFIEKKNKKGLIKKTDIKPAIKSHRYERESLFIVLKTGQGIGENAVPALRADALMNVIAPDAAFNIKRTKFFDKDLREL